MCQRCVFDLPSSLARARLSEQQLQKGASRAAKINTVLLWCNTGALIEHAHTCAETPERDMRTHMCANTTIASIAHCVLAHLHTCMREGVGKSSPLFVQQPTWRVIISARAIVAHGRQLKNAPSAEDKTFMSALRALAQPAHITLGIMAGKEHNRRVVYGNKQEALVARVSCCITARDNECFAPTRTAPGKGHRAHVLFPPHRTYSFMQTPRAECKVKKA